MPECAPSRGAPVTDGTARVGRLLVIGVGHRDRGDDGIGPAVVDELSHRGAGLTTVVREGDLAVLPLLWEADDDVVIVDATISSGQVGVLHEVHEEDLVAGIGWSTHGMNVSDAIQLARRLKCLPARLRIFGITGKRFGHEPMSAELHHRVHDLADELLTMLEIDTAGSAERRSDSPHPVPL